MPEVDNAERTAIYDEMNRVLAALHSVSVDEVGLSDYGKPGNYYAHRWPVDKTISRLRNGNLPT